MSEIKKQESEDIFKNLQKSKKSEGDKDIKKFPISEIQKEMNENGISYKENISFTSRKKKCSCKRKNRNTKKEKRSVNLNIKNEPEDDEDSNSIEEKRIENKEKSITEPKTQVKIKSDKLPDNFKMEINSTGPIYFSLETNKSEESNKQNENEKENKINYGELKTEYKDLTMFLQFILNELKEIDEKFKRDTSMHESAIKLFTNQNDRKSELYTNLKINIQQLYSVISEEKDNPEIKNEMNEINELMDKMNLIHDKITDKNYEIDNTIFEIDELQTNFKILSTKLEHIKDTLNTQNGYSQGILNKLNDIPNKDNN